MKDKGYKSRDGPGGTDREMHHDNRIHTRRTALMKKTEKAVLIEGLRKLSADAAWIADTLEGKVTPDAAEETPIEDVTAKPEEETKEAPEAPAEEKKEVTFEDVRALLADKARAGYKAEVKALLTSHGVNKLSEITDPEELSKVVQEAEGIGNG